MTQTGIFAAQTSGVNGVHLDGLLDWATRDAAFTGEVNGQNITLAFRFRMDDDISGIELFNNTGNTVRLFFFPSVDYLELDIENETGTEVLRIHGSNNSIKKDTFYNLLISAKLSATATAHYFIDDVSDLVTETLTQGETLDLTAADWSVGAGPGGNDKLAGDITFFWYDDVYYDFSQVSNRRLFFNADGTPALSVTGDGTPDGGSQPILYLAGLFNQWENNKGTGGGMTENGEFTQPTED